MKPLAFDSDARATARAMLATGLFTLAVWIAWDFLSTLAWAVIIASSLWPAYAWFAKQTGTGTKSNLAAALFTLLVAIMIFLPVVLGLQQLGEVREPATQWINQARESGIPVPGWLSQAPLAGEYIAQIWKANLSDPKAVARMLSGLDTDSMGGWLQAFGGNLLQRLLLFGIALGAIFFLLRDGNWIARRTLETLDTIFGGAGESLALKMLDAMRGIVTGTVLVAMAEGIIIGIGYVVAGVPQPIVLACLTAAFAMLPFGAWVAFSGAALLLVAEGQSTAGGAVFAWGAFVMLAGDHFVFPVAIGKAARLPFIVALIGIFGGLQAFGLVGLFVGPALMAAILTIWREWLGVRDVMPPKKEEAA